MKKNNSRYRLRDANGKFVRKIFSDAVVRALAAQKGIDSFQQIGKVKIEKKAEVIRKEAKITDRELFIFYKTNEETFEDMIKTGSLKNLSKNSNQLEKILSEYKGDIILNGKKVSASKAKLKLIEFKQLLSSEINAVDFEIKPKFFFDGRIEIDLPDPYELIDELMQFFSIENLDDLDDFAGEEITNALKKITDENFGEGEIIIHAS